jgi:hypothetical protein
MSEISLEDVTLERSNYFIVAKFTVGAVSLLISKSCSFMTMPVNLEFIISDHLKKPLMGVSEYCEKSVVA